ncbi:hypothetical protein [Sulfurospirillum deleyianum]|uniref:Uncharacterized protein n=1 Tax=Sulfurospirillum deleyianum (strain ATCC 51133 / DSM 6946 / 5175) TaxID=525898 RepID=D1B4V9_SULD5|nr:hypothetical protein [Sulfurospirillum deleyianum]ACZ13129.1 conserved hypothetical protein [Sulfurospirillum deleyianum DSM 6946]
MIEIPHEKNETLEGIQKVMYAQNEQGVFERYNYGSSVEEFATKVAVEEYELLKHECLERIKRGEDSPIAFYMYENRMDLPTLASAVGMFQFRVKRHLKMGVFKRMSDGLLKRYADAFSISLSALKEFH